MATYTRILVGVDGSNEAEAALRRGIKLAKTDGATLGIGFVADIRRIAPLIDYEQTYAKKAKAYGEELVEIYRNEAERAGVKQVKTFVHFGTPKSTLVRKIAKQFEPDIMLVGSTGLTATEQFLLGSVSEYVAGHAPCDVIIVRGKAWNERKDEV
ncbi:universal stress protein [Listeria ilorinensis]|uniref:universal stress protein n=1 Tax=Listeria ilorinensis TaxID=2867439 RepID=UPI001EF74364|nr:universal stress protein [Listeria ilorinensis]